MTKPHLTIIKNPERTDYVPAVWYKEEVRLNTTDGGKTLTFDNFSSKEERVHVFYLDPKLSFDAFRPIEFLQDLDDIKSMPFEGKSVTITAPARRKLNKMIVKQEALIDGADVTQVQSDNVVLSNASFMDWVAEELEGLGLSSGTGGEDLGTMLKVYEGKKHMLITGHAGVSKTYTVSKFAKSCGRQEFFKALDNGTETIDLVGHLIKLTNGEFAWKDGVVTKAFREASKGNKVILFLDELLRCPEKELSLLVGCLTPNSDNNLVLRTGRPLEGTLVDGVVEEEVLEANIEHLWCVATTNQGRNYHTGKIDMALKDRFRIFEQTMSEAISKLIAVEVIKNTCYGATMSDTAIMSVLDSIYRVVNAVATHVDTDGKLKQYITIRHITEVLNLSTNVKDIKPRMLELVSNLVIIDSSGNLNREQVGIIKDYIRMFIK